MAWHRNESVKVHIKYYHHYFFTMWNVTGALVWIVSNKNVERYKSADWGREVVAAVNLANN